MGGATENAGVENAGALKMQGVENTGVTGNRGTIMQGWKTREKPVWKVTLWRLWRHKTSVARTQVFWCYILDVSDRLIYNKMWCLWLVIYGKIIDSTYYVLSRQHSMRNTSVNKNSHMSLCSLVRRLKQTQHHLDIRATLEHLRCCCSTCSTQPRQKRWWPQGTSANRVSRGVTKHTSQTSFYADTGSMSLSSTLGKTWLLGLYRVYI